MNQSEPQNDCAVCRYWEERLATLADVFGDEERVQQEGAEHQKRSHSSEVGTPGRGER